MIQLSSGKLQPDVLELILKNLSLELTYIDEDDLIQYYTDIPAPLFSRSPDLIGTPVVDCHGESKPEVIQILRDFKNGRLDFKTNYSSKDGKRIFVKYLALRDTGGNYRGCLEIVQDVSQFGEKD